MFNTQLYAEANLALWLLAVVISYFLGNISPAILISKASGFDIRSKGSGNAGTTNMLRVMGKKAAATTLLVDILKGVVAVWIGRLIGGEPLAVFSAFAVFIGHFWPLAVGFRGGKGIATGLGVLLALNPLFGLSCLAVAAAGLLVSGRISVGSLLVALALPFIAYYYLPDYIGIFLAMAIIIIIKHRSNLRRLFRGEEPRVHLKKNRTKS